MMSARVLLLLAAVTCFVVALLSVLGAVHDVSFPALLCGGLIAFVLGTLVN